MDTSATTLVSAQHSEWVQEITTEVGQSAQNLHKPTQAHTACSLPPRGQWGVAKRCLVLAHEALQTGGCSQVSFYEHREPATRTCSETAHVTSTHTPPGCQDPNSSQPGSRVQESWAPGPQLRFSLPPLSLPWPGPAGALPARAWTCTAPPGGSRQPSRQDHGKRTPW